MRFMASQVERTCQEGVSRSRLLSQLGDLTPKLMEEGGALVTGWARHEEMAR